MGIIRNFTNWLQNALNLNPHPSRLPQYQDQEIVDFTGERDGTVFKNASYSIHYMFCCGFGGREVIWHNGIITSGDFTCDKWENGTFEGNVLSCGSWEKGIFSGHKLKCTQWLGGTFKGDLLESNSWSGGVFDGKPMRRCPACGELTELKAPERINDSYWLCPKCNVINDATKDAIIRQG